MIRTLPTPETLAVRFSATLREWLSAYEMALVIAKNREEQTPLVCHSHDYCDANMAMLEAFELFGLDPCLQDQELVELWNTAWSVAAKMEFGFRK